MTSMTMLACSNCWNPIGAGAKPVLLGDLAFHPVCAPRCRACDSSLTDLDEEGVTYSGQVSWDRTGHHVRPTEPWCDSCRRLHERDTAPAQG